MKPHKVHIGFGFHANCYHSYRGDTPDALGFGGDIRIIRHIIHTLDGWNARGVPVKGTWDFENAYSLERILPQYAPDILEAVRRRQLQNGDENILMGYNNGAMSAMTEDEFLASVKWAVTNEKGSGLADIFGSCEPIVRPQEVMFTPSQAALYRKAGIQAVCLYYSCVPFDAFRTLIPQLEDEAAFNPLTYSYNGESITILPTYSQSDLMDAGSLRWLVTDLHQKQQRGEIGHDVFLFINMDADSFLWEPFPVPAPLRKLPNFGGLGGLIGEVQDLDFVEFDTPEGYLRSHPPLREVFFGQDVADGNFSGYASWAEKPFNRQIWTRLERARALARAEGKDASSASFETRIRLLSTTHFGLASPVLNVTRQAAALQLSAQALELERRSARQPKDLTLCGSAPRTLFCAQLALEPGYCTDITALEVKTQDLAHFTAHELRRHPDGSLAAVYLVCCLQHPAQQCTLHFDTAAPSQGSVPLSGHRLEQGGLGVCPAGDTGFPQLWQQGKLLAETHSFITYRGRRVGFAPPVYTPLALGGEGRGLRFSGEIHLPGELEPGRYQFDFFTSGTLEVIFLASTVRYPYTREKDRISSQASNLGRATDRGWQETAPLAFTLRLSDDAVLCKRNFMADLSRFPLSDFWKAFPRNAQMDSFNHQLTGGLLCLSDGQQGLALAHDRQVLGSMAHCPIRLRTEPQARAVTLNPFGTFYGKQRAYPTRGNGCCMDLYTATMPQAQSLAPAYNGAFEQSLQALCFAPAGPDEQQQELLCSIADSPAVLGGELVHAFTEDNALPHSAPGETSHPGRLRAVALTGEKATLPRTALRFVWNMLRAGRLCRKARLPKKKQSPQQ